jgi:DNA polymerase-3 subunit beta
MKFVTLRDELQQAIGVVQRAVSTRSTLPILSNILLEADEDGLTLSATDLEIGIRARLAVDTVTPGRTTLPARLLNELVGAQPSGPPLEIESNDQDRVFFRCGRSEMDIHGLPADEFPVIPSLESETRLRVPQGLLKAMIGGVIIAVSHDETRARLTGMFMTVEDGRLRLVATDTHRLATQSERLPEPPLAVVSAIIPARALREVERLLSEHREQAIEIVLTENQVQFTFEDATVVSRLIEGEFPNYRKVIPASSDWRLSCPLLNLRESVRRCAIVSRDDHHKLVLRAALGGEVQLTAESARVGKADEVVDGVNVEGPAGAGEPIEIAFNAEYLLAVLNYLQTEEVILQLSAANLPGAVRPTSDEEDYVYVLMPMQMV